MGTGALTRLAGLVAVLGAGGQQTVAGRQVPSFSRLLCSSRIFLRPPTLLLFGGGSDLASTHGLDGGASSLSSEAALTSSLLLLLPCCLNFAPPNSGRSTIERLWCCWCSFRRCCRRADRSGGRLLYSSGLILCSVARSALSRLVGDTRPYLVGWEDTQLVPKATGLSKSSIPRLRDRLFSRNRGMELLPNSVILPIRRLSRGRR